MKKTLVLAITITFCTFQSQAQMRDSDKAATTVTVGGELMYAKKNIVENAVNSKDHTTLVAAVKAAGLVETLMGKGPFTVLAPVNNAFEDLPAGTVETLLKPENKGTLTAVLTYHVLSGNYSFNDIAAAIKKGNGKAVMKTVQGQELTFWMNGMHNISVTDATGATANIATYDVMQSNGVIHVLDKVLMPKM
ncbi:MAG: fasciclin domain-containing protein [Bacteroidia bacterium]|nr:fasciclin domain-containing protein [Bacteroidia bacterium]